MQTGFEGCIPFSPIKSCIQKVCSVSLVWEALLFSLSLFLTRPSTNIFYKITQNSALRCLNILITILLGQHVLDRPYNRKNVNGQRHIIILSSTTRLCTEFKETSVDTYTENRVIRRDSRFINNDPVSTREELLSGTSSELKKTSKHFQVPTATINTSIKNTGVTLQKSDSKLKL